MGQFISFAQLTDPKPGPETGIKSRSQLAEENAFEIHSTTIWNFFFFVVGGGHIYYFIKEEKKFLQVMSNYLHAS